MAASPLLRARLNDKEIRELRVRAARLELTVPELLGLLVREELSGRRRPPGRYLLTERRGK